MRGHFRSRDFGLTVAEAHQLAEEGEGIDFGSPGLSRYGEDLATGRAGNIWLRVVAHGRYRVGARDVYPIQRTSAMGFSTCWQKSRRQRLSGYAIATCFAERFEGMKRGGKRESLERLIERVRERVPGIAVRTTFITGFPGETDTDFEELLKFV